MDFSWLLGFLFFIRISSSTSLHHTSPIVAFWHIFWNETIDYSILNEQFTVLNSSGLFHQLDALYLSTIGLPFYNLSSLYNHKKIHHQSHHNIGHEGYTLSSIYEYCHQSPQSKVLYFHNKGSYTTNWRNVRLRTALDCYLLTPSCIPILDQYDTCGMRVSLIPKLHYPGNFWWSTCRHINRLIHPLSYENNETLKDLTDSLYASGPPMYDWCVGAERFFSEHWLLSSPLVNPADCLPAYYLYGYKMSRKEVTQLCVNFNTSRYTQELQRWEQDPNHRPNYPNSTTCGIPHVLKDKHLYWSWVRKLLQENCSSIQSAWKRTQYWYGQRPVTFLDWSQRLFQRPLTKEDLNL